MDITAIAIVGIIFGCGTGIISKFLETFGGRKKDALTNDLKSAQDRVRMLELQVVESHRQNDQLQKQLEWHTKMLETQDRLMKQLSDGQARPAEAVR